METKLGKISNISFGIGGRQDACIGLHVILSGKGWDVQSSIDYWDYNLVKWTSDRKWSEDERSEMYVKTIHHISNLLRDANVTDIVNLKGMPVEVTLDEDRLKSWRILTEVI